MQLGSCPTTKIALAVIFFSQISWAGQCIPSGSSPVLVYTLGNLRPAVLPGLLQRLEERKIIPSSVVVSCGGALPSAIYDSLGGAKATHNYMKSTEFHQFLKLTNTNQDRTGFRFFKTLMGLGNLGKVIPDFESMALLQTSAERGTHLLPENMVYTADQVQSRTVVLATKLLYSSSSEGQTRSTFKLFSEAYFGSSKLLGILESRTSDVALQFPESALERSTVSINSVPIYKTVIASMSEPTALPPFEIDGLRYIAGSANLYPMEVGKAIAKALGVEMVMTKNPPLNDGEESVLGGTYGIVQNRRLAKIQGETSVTWIDVADRPQTKGIFFDLKPVFFSLSASLYLDLPASHSDFQKRIEAQWQYGRELADQIICQ
jgi:hypothetical protein